ncbi:MAG: PQQ-dependent sugar dehydrogenase, partial [Woeseiaceae bacterium]|nr:PQQ-dependent sugar dehydrogenase [Woeseiaceae bacterium]
MWRRAVLLSSLLASPAIADVDLDDISLPPGFAIEVYAEVDDARSLALGGNGVVFVGSRGADTVSAIFPGTAGRTRVFEIDDDLDRPHGVAYKDGDLYVAEIDHVYAYRGIDGRLSNPPRREELNIDLPRPSTRNHQYRDIAFDPEGRLVVAIGAPCNVCDREGFGTIDRVKLDGSERETIAYGVRNSVGVAFHPDTGELWFTDNGRDMLGDDIPPDELNHLAEEGQHFG